MKCFSCNEKIFGMYADVLGRSLCYDCLAGLDPRGILQKSGFSKSEIESYRRELIQELGFIDALISDWGFD